MYRGTSVPAGVYALARSARGTAARCAGRDILLIGRSTRTRDRGSGCVEHASRARAGRVSALSSAQFPQLLPHVDLSIVAQTRSDAGGYRATVSPFAVAADIIL